MVSGIYSISLDDGRCYIGSAVDYRKRWKIHKHSLKKGNHHSAKLQHAWNKYGEDRFTFRMIENCEVDKLIDREQFWNSKALNQLADEGASDDAVTKITKKVNGGTLGLDDRISHFKKYYGLLNDNPMDKVQRADAAG